MLTFHIGLVISIGKATMYVITGLVIIARDIVPSLGFLDRLLGPSIKITKRK